MSSINMATIANNGVGHVLFLAPKYLDVSIMKTYTHRWIVHKLLRLNYAGINTQNFFIQ
jgi:hypothetical protein